MGNSLWVQRRKDKLDELGKSNDTKKIASVYYDLGMTTALGYVLYAISEDCSMVEIQSFVYGMIEGNEELAKDVHAMKNHLKDNNIGKIV